jgi:hypothetical protein
MESDSSMRPVRWQRFLSNHNPLYLVSAWVVLLGISQAFQGEIGLRWIPLMTELLCVYTLAIALAGWLVVRVGKIWDDARMIMLVVLLMFTALSTSYDDLCLKDPVAGWQHLAFGYVFSCATTEAILHALGMKLPLRYRLPFYLQLAVLFAFPAILGELSVAGNDPAMCAGVVLFPVTAGAALLTLWPAAGAKPERENGTPWPWPLYPWSIFIFVAVASVIRAWMLSVSFSPAAGVVPAFLPYLVCPILLAMIVLLLELGLRQQSRVTQRLAMLALLVVAWLAFPGTRTNSAQRLLLDLMESSFAGPPMLVCGAVVLIAVYGMVRRAAGSEALTVLALLLLACVQPETRSWKSLGAPNPQILSVLVVWQLGYGQRTLNMPRLAVGGITAMFLAADQFNIAWLFANHAFWFVQFALLWLMLLPLFCRDSLARALRAGGPVWMTGTATAAMIAGPIFDWGLPPWMPALIATSMIGVAVLYGVILRVRWYALPAGWATALACVGWSIAALSSLHEMQLRRGLAIYALGCFILAAALVVSFWKAGLAHRMWLWLQSHAPPSRNGATPVSGNTSQ